MTLYVDTSAVLRAIVERGTSPDVERRLADANGLVTSRLAIVEAARAFPRAKSFSSLPAERLAALEAEVARVWTGCAVWELSPEVCALAGLELLTADRRLADAVAAAGA